MLEVIILKVQMYPIYQTINCQIYEIKNWFCISELQSDAKVNSLSKCGIAFNLYEDSQKGKTGTGNENVTFGRLRRAEANLSQWNYQGDKAAGSHCPRFGY